jgi:protein disulfide-isomerase
MKSSCCWRVLLCCLAWLWVGAVDAAAEGEGTPVAARKWTLLDKEISWMPNLAAAQELAAREERFVMLYFTGSDWCGWCRKLDSEVLKYDLFHSFAGDYLAAVKVDFPKSPIIPEWQYRANMMLAEKYKVQGYPTLVFLDTDGREVHRRGYLEGGVYSYLVTLTAELRKTADVTLRRRHDKVKRDYDRAQGTGGGAPLPLFGGAAAAAPARFTNLVLKSITGPANRRLALLNNQTLSVGESVKVPLGERTVKVRCAEIRERSVLVQVEGEPEAREVRLAGGE